MSQQIKSVSTYRLSYLFLRQEPELLPKLFTQITNDAPEGALFVPFCLRLHRQRRGGYVEMPVLPSTCSMVREQTISFFSEQRIRVHSDRIGSYSLLCLISLTPDELRLRQIPEQLELLERLVAHINGTIQCGISAYLGRVGTSEQLTSETNSLLETFCRVMLPVYAVRPYWELAPQEQAVPDLLSWSQLIATGKLPELQAQIDALFALPELSDAFDVVFSCRIYQTFMQAVYTALSNCHVPAYMIFSESDRIYTEHSAIANPIEMKAFFLYCVRTAVNAITHQSEGADRITQIKEYIVQNLDADLSRTVIAGQFFLHPDYLSHIFRLNTGVPLSSYIQSERLSRAQFLLRSTTIPVSDIALQIGYSNFSHFSNLFRKRVGLSPTEYRSRGSL